MRKKIDKEDERKIYKLWKEGYSMKEIAKMYEVSNTLIWLTVNGMKTFEKYE